MTQRTKYLHIGLAFSPEEAWLYKAIRDAAKENGHKPSPYVKHLLKQMYKDKEVREHEPDRADNVQA